MPQYQYPGVYVEEVVTEARPIPGVSTEGEPLQRPDFFSGQLLDAASLRREQDYFREKLRRHNLAAHGYGIVEGLGVSVDSTSDPDGSRIIVEPGVAFDPRGEQVALPRGAALAAPSNDGDIYVALCFWEHPCPETSPPDGHSTCGCIEEACLVGLKLQLSSPWLAVGRLTRKGGSWSVDPTFQPPRVRAAPPERAG
jgi:hypothetical protein